MNRQLAALCVLLFVWLAFLGVRCSPTVSRAAVNGQGSAYPCPSPLYLAVPVPEPSTYGAAAVVALALAVAVKRHRS